MTILDRPCNILLTSVGNEAVHGFEEDLRRRAPEWQLIGVDVRPDAAGLYRCDRRHLVPTRDDPRWSDAIRQVIHDDRIDVVIPLATAEQEPFADPAFQAELGVPVVVSPHSAVSAANRKIALFRALEGHADLLPDHVVVTDKTAAARALDALVRAHGAALLKTDIATGGASMLCVGEPGEDPAPVAGRRWLSMDVVRAALDRGGEAIAQVAVPELTVESSWPRLAVAYLPGSEYSVDLLADVGHVLGGVVRRRSRAVGGLALTAETVDEPDVFAAAARIVKELGLSYVLNVQFRRDASGRPRLLEINPRIPGTIALTVAAGLNLPVAAVQLALGERPRLPAPTIGLRIFRFSGGVITDAPPPAAP